MAYRFQGDRFCTAARFAAYAKALGDCFVARVLPDDAANRETPPFFSKVVGVARANPVWKDVSDGDGVLVVFRTADAYVSPNWYPSKPEFHKQVPNWNYMVAHAYGRITIRDESASCAVWLPA